MIKQNIAEIVKKVFCIIGIIATIFFCHDLYKKNVFRENMLNQLSIQTNPIEMIGKWSISKKSVTTILPGDYFKSTRPGVLLTSISESPSDAGTRDIFVISLHTPFVPSGHCSDLFLRIICPEFSDGFLDPSPILYYSIDDKSLIVTKIRSWTFKDGMLYIYFRPNVYDFLKECENANKLTFVLNTFTGKPIIEDFNLKNFSVAIKNGRELLNREYPQ